jgi:hypothetical protein
MRPGRRRAVRSRGVRVRGPPRHNNDVVSATDISTRDVLRARRRDRRCHRGGERRSPRRPRREPTPSERVRIGDRRPRDNLQAECHGCGEPCGRRLPSTSVRRDHERDPSWTAPGIAHRNHCHRGPHRLCPDPDCVPRRTRNPRIAEHVGHAEAVIGLISFRRELRAAGVFLAEFLAGCGMADIRRAESVELAGMRQTRHGRFRCPNQAVRARCHRSVRPRRCSPGAQSTPSRNAQNYSRLPYQRSSDLEDNRFQERAELLRIVPQLLAHEQQLGGNLL